MDIATVLAVLALLVSALAVGGVLVLAREVGLLLVRVGPSRPLITPTEGVDIGTKLNFPVTTLEGQTLILGEPSPRRRLLVFTSPFCEVCEDLKQPLKAFARDYRREIELIVLSRAESSTSDADWARQLRGLDAHVVAAPAAHIEFGIRGTPFAMILAPSGEVTARGAISNLEQLESLGGAEYRIDKIGPASRKVSLGNLSGESGAQL